MRTAWAIGGAKSEVHTRRSCRAGITTEFPIKMLKEKRNSLWNWHPTETDEMNMKRVVRYMKGVSSEKCVIEIVTSPRSVNVYPDSVWAGQSTICKRTSGGVVQWATLAEWVTNNMSVSLSSAEATPYALTTSAQRTVTKDLMSEPGKSVTLLSHIDRQAAKAWTTKRSLGRNTSC